MKNQSKHPIENKADNCAPGSENIAKNEKYIKKLLVQRDVLTKLTGNIKKASSVVKSQDSSISESNQSQTSINKQIDNHEKITTH